MSSDLPKLRTELTKIGHIFRKESTIKTKVFKKFRLLKLIFTEKKIGNIQFLMPKNDLETTNFANFEEVVHNFGRSDNDMI